MMGAKYNNPDYIGRKFERLTIIEVESTERKGRKFYMWRCKCDCGKEVVVRPYDLIGRKWVKSCGCYRASSKTGLPRDEYRRIYVRESRKLLKKHHMCINCQKQDAFTLAGHQMCFECNEKRRKYPFEPIEEKKTKSPKIQRAEWLSYGLCSRCGKEPIKEGIRPWVNTPYKVCEKCYQHCLKMKEAYKRKYEPYGIRYITPPTSHTKKAIDTYKKLLEDQKERRRRMDEETRENNEVERTC